MKGNRRRNGWWRSEVPLLESTASSSPVCGARLDKIRKLVKEGPTKGVCGATADTMVVRNLVERREKRLGKPHRELK